MFLELLILSKLSERNNSQESSTQIQKVFPDINIKVNTYWTRTEKDGTKKKIKQISDVNIFSIIQVEDYKITCENNQVIETSNTVKEIEDKIKERTKYLNLA